MREHDDNDAVAIFVRLDSALASLLAAWEAAREFGDAELTQMVQSAIGETTYARSMARKAAGLVAVPIPTAAP